MSSSMMPGMSGMVESMMESMGMGAPPPGMVDSMMQGMMSGQGLPGMPGVPTAPAALGNASNQQFGGSCSSGFLHTSKSGRIRVLAPDTNVTLQGLKSRPSENGKTGKILGFDEDKGRYMVGEIQGVDGPLALKPANFVQRGVRVDVVGGAATSEGPPPGGRGDAASGGVVQGAGATTSSNPSWEVEVPSAANSTVILPTLGGLDSPCLSLKNKSSGELKENVSGESELRLGTGTSVRVVGLQSDKGKVWNEAYGVVTGYDEAAGRYGIDLGGSTYLKIKPANLAL